MRYVNLLVVVFTISIVTLQSIGEQDDVDSEVCSGAANNPSWLVVILAGERRFSGTLIHPRAVLTAAHLLNGTQELQIDVNGKRENVTNVHTHPQFNARMMFYDVAILELGNPVEGTSAVCLPSKDESYNMTLCAAAVMNSSGDVQRFPLEALAANKCQRLLRRRLGANFELHISFRCAKTSCQIHGGSALLCPVSEDKWVQIGVSSWGLRCGSAPEIYIDVKMVLPWITQVLNFE